MSALLEAASLSKTFFSEHNALPAVCNVSFSVAPGECLGLAGASGCGKSTIFRLINGLEKLQQGRILVDGCPVQELKNYSAFMPQKDLLFPWRTIEKNICLPMELAKVPKAEVMKIAELKMPDLNAASVEAAYSMICGTARSMGIVVEE